MALTSPDYVVFSIEHTLSPLLVLKFFKSPWGLSEINKNTQGTVRSRLYFENLKNINFPFCGATGQGQAESVLTRFKEINDQVYLVQSKMKIVLNDTLNKTFRGELVTHNKDDETAQKFIDRIKRIKSNVPAKKSSKKTKALSMRSNKPTLKDLIKVKFSGTEFTYKELAEFVNSESELEYDELKDLFFNLLREPINNTENKPYLVQKLTGEGQAVFQINTTS